MRIYRVFLLIPMLALVLFATNQCAPATSPQSGNANLATSSTQSGNSPAIAMAQEYFYSQVLPHFQANCKNCHDSPRNIAPSYQDYRASTVIYNYQFAKEFLADGSDELNNTLMNHLLNSDQVHGLGGNVCSSGNYQGTCQLVVDWYKLEFGLKGTIDISSGGNNSSNHGQVLEISLDGIIKGFAQNPDNLSQIIEVEIYVDGNMETGTYLATVSANLPSSNYNNKLFSYQVPNLYRDGNTRTFTIYAAYNGQKHLLSNGEQNAAMYPLNNINFYNQNVRPLLETQCGQCHASDYFNRVFALGSPKPYMGGSKINNELINKGSGIGHGGGNRCGGINNGACQAMQDWWDQEFANN